MKMTIKTDSKQQKIKGTNARNNLYLESEIWEPPLITYYAKVIDNLSDKDITSYKNAMDNDFTWYYGTCNVNGGESQYIVQFDIWNNEPAFNHRGFDKRCADAYNVYMSFEIKSAEVNDEGYIFELKHTPFVKYRMLLDNYDTEWQYVQDKIQLIGNVNPQSKKLLGEGDHCIVQTKIVLPSNLNFNPNRYHFTVNLSYDYI